MTTEQIQMIGLDGKVGPKDAVLTELLTSDNELARCVGRALASGMNEAATEWANDEFARGTSPTMIMQVLAGQSIQLTASIAAAALTDDGVAAVAELYRSMISDMFAGHAAKARALATEQTG